MAPVWMDFVRRHLMQVSELKAGAIIGHDYVTRASSANFPRFVFDDITSLLDGFEDPETLVNGITFGGKSYTVIQEENEENIIRGILGTEHITIKKTLTLFVVGIYEESPHNYICDQYIRRLAEYLVTMGF